MSEHDDLTNLLKSPGWLWLKAYADETFTTNLAQHVESAANDRDDATALNKLRQVLAAQKAVRALIAAPTERVKKLEEAVAVERAPQSLSRRGGL